MKVQREGQKLQEDSLEIKELTKNNFTWRKLVSLKYPERHPDFPIQGTGH